MEYRVNNIIQNTTSNTTQVVVISVPVATTNIQLVCYSDNQTNNWNVTINSFTAESEKTYECVFNDGRVSRLSLKPTGTLICLRSETESCKYKHRKYLLE